MRKTKDRIGETKLNNKGESMTIIEYNGAKDMIVQFKNNAVVVVNVEYNNFKNGKVKNPLFRSVCKVGYIGVGEYKFSIDGKLENSYLTWKSMLDRCYSKKIHKKYPSYIGCTVCEEWHNFQVFAEWFSENYYEIEGDRIELDKDILVKGNKIYSPNNCLFVPARINYLFVRRFNIRGAYPIGVYFNKKRNGFIAQCRNQLNNKLMNLGCFDNAREAFNTYKIYKENHIKEIADSYKDKIPNKLYSVMYKYEVEITD